jgi:uncharacterized protein with HEPN domain
MNRDILHITLILESISEIEQYIDGVDEDEFLSNSMLRDACLMKLIIIGENGGKVSKDLRSRFSEVEWQQMKAARNFFAHEYERIDWSRIWMTVYEILPELKLKLEKVSQSLKD